MEDQNKTLNEWKKSIEALSFSLIPEMCRKTIEST